jgi:hypothetical protein
LKRFTASFLLLLLLSACGNSNTNSGKVSTDKPKETQMASTSNNESVENPPITTSLEEGFDFLPYDGEPTRIQNSGEVYDFENTDTLLDVSISNDIKYFLHYDEPYRYQESANNTNRYLTIADSNTNKTKTLDVVFPEIESYLNDILLENEGINTTVLNEKAETTTYIEGNKVNRYVIISIQEGKEPINILISDYIEIINGELSEPKLNKKIVGKEYLKVADSTIGKVVVLENREENRYWIEAISNEQTLPNKVNELKDDYDLINSYKILFIDLENEKWYIERVEGAVSGILQLSAPSGEPLYNGATDKFIELETADIKIVDAKNGYFFAISKHGAFAGSLPWVYLINSNLEVVNSYEFPQLTGDDDTRSIRSGVVGSYIEGEDNQTFGFYSAQLHEYQRKNAVVGHEWLYRQIEQ